MGSVAWVTGASRGIGRAAAVALARHGCDIVLSARTVTDADGFEHSLTVTASDAGPLAGSLSSVAAEIRAIGRQAWLAPFDLTDVDAAAAAVRQVLTDVGLVDVLVNNGRYVGPGTLDHFVDTPIELIDLHLRANVLAPMALIQGLLRATPHERELRIVNVSSSTGTRDPSAATGEGGWSMGYGVSKGAFHRIAGILRAERGDRRLFACNVMPGPTATERMSAVLDSYGFGPDQEWAAPSMCGDVIGWLGTADEAWAYDGQAVDARTLTARIEASR